MRFVDAGRPRRGFHGAVIVGLLLGLSIPSAAIGQSTSSDQIERELEDARNEERQRARELDAVQARIEAAEIELAELGVRLEEARGQLVAAEGQVALGEAALVEAESERDIAGQEHEQAVAALDRAEARLLREEDTLATQLVESFKHGAAGMTHGAMLLEILRRAEDPNAFAVGMKQLQIVMDVQDATVKNVFELREEQSELADDAARARSRATQAAADAEETLRVLEGLRAEAEDLAHQVAADEQRQREVLGSLEQTEEQTSALLLRVSDRQDVLRTELREARAEEAAAAAAAAAASGGSGRAGATGGPPIDGMICPVVGAVAGRDFQNDWGFPRSGGRSHQGNDLFAARGTAVVAVGDGEIVRWNPPSRPTGLGGITVTYRTEDGSEWYNAHLDSIAAGISPGVRVRRGDVVGTVGNTGNARTTPPHLHLGRRYAGAWVNPWTVTSPVCG